MVSPLFDSIVTTSDLLLYEPEAVGLLAGLTTLGDRALKTTAYEF